MSAVGQVFGNRYVIEESIARGGMAEVFLAHDRTLDRRVALKVLFAEYAREPSFVERFRREAQSAAALNHPNIVSIYDWGQEKGTYFIVMEYVDGRSLRDMIRSSGPIEAEIAINIAAEIASALDQAHRHGVVHRDIKPGNVLVTPNGVVKVGDFGIARAGTSDALTQTGSVMGTATYFSPEQAQGLPVDARSDVYSLGVVLYEMLTGVPPFTGDSPVAVAYKHVREEPVMPSRRNPAINADLEQVVATAMAKDPNRRYQSAADLREDLQRVRRGRAPAAAPVTALVAPVAAAGAYADATAVQPQVERHPTAEYVAPRGGVGRTIAAVITVIALAAAIALILFLTKRAPKTAAKQVAPPQVVGLSEDAAVRTLEGKDFKVGDITYKINSAVPPGNVVSQAPDSHTLVDKGSTVDLVVSGIRLPDVSGKNATDAKAILVRNGFTADPQTHTGGASDLPAGTVLSTDPAGGTVVGPTTTIVLVLSPGPKAIDVPDVSGKTYNDAVSALQQAGFTTFQEVHQASDTVPSGKVISTDPAAGASATKLDTIKVNVSSGPANITVPDVTTDSDAVACNTLQNMGLKCKEHFVPDANNVGIVIDQNPVGGTSVAPGSTVTITVGKQPSPTTTATTAPGVTTTT